LQNKKVPVSPPSILGYRDVVVTRREKKRVLRDDLALLRRCDEMWVFCERDLRQEGLGSLAEGLVVELLYAHQFCPKMPIYFVNVRSLLIGEIEKDAYPIDLNKSGSKSEQSQFISELHSFVLESERLIPKVQYYLMDPLDFKYAEWLRVGPHRKAFVPIVPFLAIELSDVDRTSSAQRHLIRAWLTLMRLADEFCVRDTVA
jgi:hypothetical protein